MNGRIFSAVIFTLILSTSVIAYNIGAKAECPNGFCACLGYLGGAIGVLIMMVGWALILGVGIIIFKDKK